MTSEERAHKIELYGSAYAILVEALARFPQVMWQFRTASDSWTIHELIVHITDSEANSYVRCRKFIAEPGSTVAAYDEPRWAKVLDYHEQNVEEALQLFRYLRHTTYRLIKTLPEATWANTVEHPENGTMTLDDWLEIYTKHIPEHVEQMQANYEAWVRG